MRREPRGLMATFVVTKTYYVSVYGTNEEDVWCNAEDLDPAKISEDDFVEMEIDIKGGFEYDSF